MSYTAIKLVKRPEGMITPDIFEVATLARPPLTEGRVRIKQSHMSLDPAMRGWMNASRRSYVAPVELGSVMRALGFGEVIETTVDAFPVGAKVMGMFGWAEEAVLPAKYLTPIPGGVDASLALSVLAIPGQTAVYGLFDLGEPKAGETIIITGGAGAVGSLVGQMAKAEGLRVIGVSGSDDKRRWMEETLGYDATVNYKRETLWDDLKQAAPDGIDIFFENTGGPIQHMIVPLMNPFGRVVVCGMIADYNKTKPSPGPSWVTFIMKRLRVQGFALTDHNDRAVEFIQRLLGYVQAGKIQHRAHIIDGLENAITGINLLFTGEKQGKLIVRL
ncbi:MAG: NADP-dependent oxidoreductase [Myxococcota bacterium]